MIRAGAITVSRGRSPDRKTGKHSHVVNYHHVIHSLRTKPGAFPSLTYRDALFPRTEYRRTWEALVAAKPMRQASRAMVDLLWLAHEHACEVELAATLDQILHAGDLPDPVELRARFGQKAVDVPPDILVQIPTTDVYDSLLSGRRATV